MTARALLESVADRLTGLPAPGAVMHELRGLSSDIREIASSLDGHAPTCNCLGQFSGDHASWCALKSKDKPA